MKRNIEAGDRFGSLTVISQDPDNRGTRNTYYICQCTCGRKVSVRRDKLLTGRTKTCRKCDAFNLNRIFNRQRTGPSGISGVSWKKRDGVYEAYLTYKGKRLYLGRFQTLEAAAQKRKEAEGYLKKHGSMDGYEK